METKLTNQYECNFCGTQDYNRAKMRRHEKWCEVLRAALLPPSCRRLVRVIIQKAQRVRVRLIPEISRAEDGGVILVFNGRSSRELTFIIPEDGSRRFFVAKSPDGDYSLAGLVIFDIGITKLCSWLVGVKEYPDMTGLRVNGDPQ